jgi:hypothetical protein
LVRHSLNYYARNVFALINIEMNVGIFKTLFNEYFSFSLFSKDNWQHIHLLFH